MLTPPNKRRRRAYTVEEKLDALDSLAQGESRSICASDSHTVMALLCVFHRLQKSQHLRYQKFETSSAETSTVLLLDNFDAHMSEEEGKVVVTNEACCSVCPLRANSTSVCQPLDVGVMGSLKSRYRTQWLRDSTSAKKARHKRLAMIKRTVKYEGIDTETISGSFEKAIPRPSTEGN